MCWFMTHLYGTKEQKNSIKTDGTRDNALLLDWYPNKDLTMMS